MPSKSSAKQKTSAATKGALQEKQKEKARRRAVSLSPEPSSLVVLGLDLSVTGAGVAAWNGQRVLLSRLYQTEPLGKKFKEGHKRGQLTPRRFKGTDEERIEWLRKRIAKCVKKIQPDLVVIEGHSFGSKGRGLSILHELHGVVKNDLHRKGHPFALKSPSTIKLAFAGHGQASKEEMVERAQEFDPRITDDNVADALGCAWFGNVNKKEFQNILK